MNRTTLGIASHISANTTSIVYKVKLLKQCMHLFFTTKGIRFKTGGGTQGFMYSSQAFYHCVHNFSLSLR